MRIENILEIVKNQPGITEREVQDALMIKEGLTWNPSINGTLKKMMSKNLIYRRHAKSSWSETYVWKYFSGIEKIKHLKDKKEVMIL